MAKKTHYEDALFFLTVMIRNLHDAVKLNIDADYFADKILEDCLFIDSVIQRIYKALVENNHLIYNSTYFHSVMKVKIVYGRLLDAVIQVDGDLRETFGPHHSRLQHISADHLDDVQVIRQELGQMDAQNIDTCIISNDELHFLLTPIE